MTYLSDIQLVLAPNELDNYRRFRDSEYHVEEIFRYFLPKEYYLHGIGKVVIQLDHNPRRQKQYYEIEKIGFYHYPDFHSDNYLQLPPKDQEQLIVTIIEQALLDLASRYGANKNPISEAAKKTREANFELSIKLATSKFHRSRRFRAEVVLSFFYGGANVDLQLVTKQENVLKKVELLRNTWSYEVYHKYRKSRWVRDVFIIYDSSGKQSFQMDFSEEINRA